MLKFGSLLRETKANTSNAYKVFEKSCGKKQEGIKLEMTVLQKLELKTC
jgi:hypothetical protein